MNLAACAALPLAPLTGTWYRAIQLQHWRTALPVTTHTRYHASRFSGGAASGEPETGFELLYLAEDQIVALFEARAMFGSPTLPDGHVANPRRTWVLAPITVFLQRVVDLTAVSNQDALQTTAQELTGDWEGYRLRSLRTSVTAPTGIAPTQALGAALYSAPSIEGFRTISAQMPYSANLILFPERLLPGSWFEWTNPDTGEVHRTGNRA